MAEPVARKRMRKQQSERWATIRARGRAWVVFRFGILRFGIPFAALITLDHYFGFIAKHCWMGFPAELYRFVFRALFFGIIMGLVFWYSGERQFHRSGSER